MPYFSVIVAVYNAENTIKKCVDSICKQSYKDLEVILIDDGSKDSSGIICDELAERDSRIKVIHKKNGGVSSARNCGIGEAIGEYILFVDSDDFWPTDFCARIVCAQNKWGKDCFYWTAIKIVSPNNKVPEHLCSYESEEYSFLDRKDILKLSAKYLLNSPVNKLYSRNIIEQSDLKMDESISIAEDLLFNLHYLSAIGGCQIVILNDATYFYVRNGEESLDHGYRKGYYQVHKEVLKRMWKYCLEWNVEDDDIPLFFYRYWDYMMAAIDNNLRSDCPLTWVKRMWENGKVVRDTLFQKSVN